MARSLRLDDFQAAPNTVIEAFVPHSAVMPRVDAMVTQCGLGSLTKALVNGVPVLCLPLVGDQPDNAARVVAQGAGIRLSADATTGALQAVVARLLSEPQYRRAAQEMARKMTATNAEDNAARELEALAPHAKRTTSRF